jgi:rhodanese-related sulfurtransferase
MSLLAALFGPSKATLEARRLIAEGARLIDVRTHEEFSMGHLDGAENIPLDRIGGLAGKLKKTGRPIVLCCASGRRSGMAAEQLTRAGVPDVVNGGGWRSLRP